MMPSANARHRRVICCQKPFSNLPQRCEFVILDVVALVLKEPNAVLRVVIFGGEFAGATLFVRSGMFAAAP
jgi:hypothetical protein